MIENREWEEKCGIEFQMIQQQLNCILNGLQFLVGDKIILHLSLNPFSKEEMGEHKANKWLNFDVWNTMDNASL